MDETIRLRDIKQEAAVTWLIENRARAKGQACLVSILDRDFKHTVKLRSKARHVIHRKRLNFDSQEKRDQMMSCRLIYKKIHNQFLKTRLKSECSS